MSRKPIFVIQTPHLNEADRKEFIETMNGQLAEDYHVLIYDNADEDSFKFRIFSDHEIEPIEIEKLKELVNTKQVTVVCDHSAIPTYEHKDNS